MANFEYDQGYLFGLHQAMKAICPCCAQRIPYIHGCHRSPSARLDGFETTYVCSAEAVRKLMGPKVAAKPAGVAALPAKMEA